MATTTGSNEPTSIMNRFTSSQEQRTALQTAFYNTLFFVLLGTCLCALFALYQMMYMFLSPMLWAVLVGTVLFPFKKKVTDVMQGWLRSLQESNTTLLVATVCFPFNTFNNIAESIYATATSQSGVVIGAAYLLLKILSYERTFMYIISWLGRVYSAMDSFILFFSRTWMFPLIVLYFCGYAAWIYIQHQGGINKKLARSLSLPIWIYVISSVSMYFGPFRAAVFGICAIVLGLISAGVLGVEEKESQDEANGDGKAKLDELSTELAANGKNEDASDTLEPPTHLTADVPLPSQLKDGLDDALSGDRLIRMIFALCALLWVVRHDSTLFLLLVPFLFALARRLGNAIGVFAVAENTSNQVFEKFSPLLAKLYEITVAGPLRQFVKMLFTSDQMLVSSLYSSMDVLSSVIVMMLLAFGVLFAVVFTGFQLHNETVHLARLASNVVSSRPDWLGAAMNFTEDQLEDHDIVIDDYVQQGYEQGRAWLASNVRALADPKDTKRADMLEQQVKEIVDKLYNIWEQRNEEISGETTAIARGDWISQLKTVTDVHALKEEITHIVKDNLDTLMNVAKSVWAIVAVNISFLSSLFAAFAGLILGFGMELINLLIELIVFLTMVYYLLSASRDRWLPIEWAMSLSAFSSSSSTSSSTYNVAGAIEQSIFGVFVLSAKMSIFYSLYTYFVHSLFDLNIVFLPCILGGLFAAVPIMAPYLVCVFGIFELWLVRGESAAALVFALMSFAPQMFADATFYREVKGSHPYVTGLAVIGGMYWLGLQGAIIGPIILCSFLVLVNVYMQFAKQNSTVSTPMKA